MSTRLTPPAPSASGADTATPAQRGVSVEHLPPRPVAQPRSGNSGWVSRITDYLFVPRNALPSSPSGVLDPRSSDTGALLAALGLALLIAAYFEAVISSNPIPPGGDPGQWLSTSYAYVGMPYPSWIVPGQYPPLLFPFLGSLVLLGGGPVMAAKLYIGAVTVLLGLSTYFLGRSLFRSATVALLVEGFVLLSPSFVSLFFFGAYPNLFGMVFLALSLGFAARFVRSHSPTHVFLFWLATTATVLSHSLVAIILIGQLAILAVFLFSQRRMPRQLYRSWGGLAGLGVFAAGVGGYYLGTSLLGISHPAYLQTNAFAYVKNGLGNIVSLLITPYIPEYVPTVDSAFQVLVGIVVVCVLVLVGLRFLAPRRLTLGVLVSVSGVLTICGLALVGWELSIVTDYVRFGYFLVLPILLTIGVAIDRVITYFATTPLRAVLPSPEGAGAAVPSPAATARRARLAPVALVGVLGFLVLLLVTATYTVPIVNRAEQNGTTVGHDQTFLTALKSVKQSNVLGSVLTEPGAVKWTRAILDRNAYAPFIPGHYSFDVTHIADGELAYFALTDRYAVTNSLVAASVMGTAPAFQNESFTYQASYFGLFQPLFHLSPTTFSVTVYNNNVTAVEPVSGIPLLTLPPTGGSWISLTFTGPDYRFTETATALPGKPTLTYTFEADATGNALLLSLQGNLSSIPGQTPHVVRGGFPGSFTWFPAIDAGALTTWVNVSPAISLGKITGYAHPGQFPQVNLSVAATKSTHGVRLLSFGLTASTPQSTNLVAGLPPLVSTPAIWTNWSSRFALLSNVSVPSSLRFGFLPDQGQWLQAEFGAQLYSTSGTWTVYLLPGNPPP